MANSKSTKDDASSNDGLALIIGGLFVLALVFATYSYFNRGSTLDSDVQSDSTERSENGKASLGERLRDLFNGRDNDDLQGKGGPIDVTDESLGSDTDSVFAQWVATDYQEGDISGSNYVVKSGDTLWEIAEARYGNGAEWTKILGENASEIGYLPNGQQALIMPGQTLVLP
ncbi:LysM peptidoglycan-binding domain-containing protein [Patescibacteria group bacterium]